MSRATPVASRPQQPQAMSTVSVAPTASTELAAAQTGALRLELVPCGRASRPAVTCSSTISCPAHTSSCPARPAHAQRRVHAQNSYLMPIFNTQGEKLTSSPLKAINTPLHL